MESMKTKKEMKNIVVEEIVGTPVEKQRIEIVERKGIGHPDSLADGMAEAISKNLCKEYLKKFDDVLHHNTDECQIVAGSSVSDYGSDKIDVPMYVLLVGRATDEFDGQKVAVDDIAASAAKEYIKKSMNNLNPDSDMNFDIKLGKGSTSLTDVFERGVAFANDTSFGIGYAPFSETESLVYNMEKRIYKEFRNQNKAIGEDVKVMGLREDDRIALTIACAFVSKHVHQLDDYVSAKEELTEKIKDAAKEYTEKDVDVYVNTADDYDRGSVYLTVTGTSADSGDDGSVGRGNRSNGIITPSRPMSMEATSGKNPVNHVGKLYNLMSNLIAQGCYKEVEGAKEVYVKMISQIGKPVSEPRVCSVQVIPEKGYDVSKLEAKAQEVAAEWLDNVPKVTDMVIKGELETF